MLELNWDVLAYVCGCVRDVPTILSISLASHTLRAVAVKRLLETQVVVLKDTRSIWSFHRFVTADDMIRLPFVRKLKLDILPGRLDEDARAEIVQFLLDLLQQATHLESLVLSHPNSTYRELGCDPRFPEAITRCSTLKELAVERWWAPMEEILSNTLSLLKTLRISLDELPNSHGGRLTPTRIYSLLGRISPTLEVLEVLGQAVTFVDRDQNNVIFPALRSFEVVSSSQFDWIWTEDMVRMFPALNGTLAFEGLYHPFQDGDGRIRKRNWASQLQKTWNSLDRVIGDVDVVDKLGLACPVRHLMLDGVCKHSKDRVRDVLHHTPPTHLKLSIDLSHGVHIFNGLLPQEVFPRLTHLVLMFSFCDYSSIIINDDDLADMQTAQWPALLTEVIAALDGARLTHLRLVVKCSMDLTNYPSVPYSKGFVDDVRNLGEGHEALASKFMKLFPTLRYVFLMTTGDRNDDFFPPGVDPPTNESGDYSFLVTQGQWLSSSGWRSVDGTPERLMSDVVDELIEAYDLILAKKDHSSLRLRQVAPVVGNSDCFMFD
ncbi:hypothetical protein ONZ51_g2303 [Trametes cubensis]|uniref:Uncharacterized protein n=1 Tax=Trametes cubensis TaxID=1111947 RepID=A0AAD7XC50_9APHY|nr:hypothetical protein ONZ51_g2303 [Trametes cubensis]